MQMEIDPNDKSQTADMIVRFTNWPAQANVYSLHYVKDIDLRVKTDLTQYRQELLQLVRDELKYRQTKSLQLFNCRMQTCCEGCYNKQTPLLYQL